MDTISALLREYQTACPERKFYLEKEIFQRNYPLAIFVARRYFNLFEPDGNDDAIQEANIAFLRAIRTFDPTKDASFSSYAVVVMRNHFGRFIQPTFSKMLRDATTSLDALSEAEVGTPERLQYLRAIATDDVSFQGVDEKDFIRWVERELPAREWYILSAHYGLDGDEPKSLREIAKELGISHERVRQIEADALRKLRICFKSGVHRFKTKKLLSNVQRRRESNSNKRLCVRSHNQSEKVTPPPSEVQTKTLQRVKRAKTKWDRKQALLEHIRANLDKSDRQIAKEVGCVSRTTINRYRKTIQSGAITRIKEKGREIRQQIGDAETGTLRKTLILEYIRRNFDKPDRWIARQLRCISRATVRRYRKET